MEFSRRDVGYLLPLFAAAVRAQERQTTPLASRLYHHERIPYEGDGRKKGRRFFYGPNRSGFNLEMHETILGPGTQTHAPHKHAHEEIVIVVEGSVEALIDGKAETVQAGSVIYFAGGQMHSARNAGSTPCRYYVVELRGADV